ncbi:uncharacterized protein M6B38_317910 [Iris pallida]|uniref:Glycosyltransferase 61 catalytic domain-containing protein n=1 Tax=Iris pallida TaxID=29817 RepID=A0AAX6HD68_IRIPA|nr:uncharacterized protein M6B38_317910 [Iris pallida]
MAKGSRRLVCGFLLLPLLYAALLRCNISPPLRLWKLQLLPHNWPQSLSVTISNDTVPERTDQFTRFILRRLVRGSARRQLSRDGVACISDPESDICVTTGPVRISTGASPTAVYLTGNQRLPLETPDASVRVRPYARKTDRVAMSRTSPVAILPGPPDPPQCDVDHSVPAVVFSTGGFAGNFFHDINDVLIPLFLTTADLHSRVQLVVTDYEGYWVRKYRRVLSRLSGHDIVVASSSSSAAEARVHCFPAAVVGLKYHGNLLCNSTSPPGGISTADFRNFIRSSLSLDAAPAAARELPVLVLLSRKKSRMLLNEEEVVGLAESVGFRVVVATAEAMRDVQEFAEAVNGCDVLMGVHGAGMTNMVFLRAGAVLLQVVPWGLDWAAAAYYGRPARRMGLQYVEYHIGVEESSLYEQYPKDDPVLVDPWGVNLKGYNVSKPVYTDGQNVRLDLSRFRETLLNARKLIPTKL